MSARPPATFHPFMASQALPLLVIALFSFVFAFAVVRHSYDRRIADSLITPSEFRLDSLARVSYLASVTAEDKRISRKFVTDTIPRLLQNGLLVRYLALSSSTRLLVHASRWRSRSSFFKASLLLEASIHDKVVGRAVPVEVRDERSGELLACADPPSSLAIFR